jgi:hypothetical protein
MTMAAITFEMTADEARAVRAFMNVAAAQKATEEQTKALARSLKTANDEAAKGVMEKAGEQGKKAWDAAAKGVDLVSKALGVLGPIAEAEFNRMTKLTDNYGSKLNTLMQALSTAGQIKLMPEVEAGLQAIKTQMYSQKELAGAYGQVTAIAKGDLNPAQRLAQVASWAAAGEAGKDQAAWLGTRVRLQTGLGKKMSDAQLDDTTAELLRSIPGGMTEEQEKMAGRMVAGGLDLTSALQMTAAGARSEEGGKTQNKILDTVLGELNPQEIRGRAKLTPAGEGRIEELAAKRLALEEALTNTKMRRSVKEAKQKELKNLGLEIEGIRQTETALSPEDQAQLELAQLKPGAERLARVRGDRAMQMRLGGVKTANLFSGWQDQEFTQPGIAGRDLAEARGVRNANPRYAAWAEKRQLETALENLKSNPTLENMQMVNTMLGDEIDVEKTPWKRAMMASPLGDMFKSGMKAYRMGGYGQGDQTGGVRDGDIPAGQNYGAAAKALENIAKHTRRAAENTAPRGNTVARNGAFNKTEPEE